MFRRWSPLSGHDEPPRISDVDRRTAKTALVGIGRDLTETQSTVFAYWDGHSKLHLDGMRASKPEHPVIGGG